MKIKLYLFAIEATLFFMATSSFLFSQEVAAKSETTVAVDDKGTTDSQRERQFVNEHLMITWSEKQDELRGFSTKLGKWSVLKLTPQSLLSVTSGGNVACVRLDHSLVAYSAEKGWWDVISIPKESTAVPIASRDLMAIQLGEHLYTFAASKAIWTSPTDPDLQPVVDKISIYANYKQLSQIKFNQNDPLLPHGNRQIDVLVDRRSKQLDGPEGWYVVTIRAGRKSYMDEVIKTYKAIELIPPLVSVPNNEINTAGEEAPGSVQESQAKIASLSEKMARLEKEAVALGKSLSSKKSPNGEDRQELADRVAQSFDARQEMQLLESRIMSLKLAKVNENLTARQTLRSRIVDRRVAELLDRSSEATSWK